MAKAEDILNEDSNFLDLGHGVQGRKGSIAATLQNIKVFDEELKKRKEKPSSAFVKATKDQKDLLPVMHTVGMMKLFTPNEWLQNDSALGRIYFTLNYLESYPEEMTDEIRSRLEEICLMDVPLLTERCAAVLGR